ncbi:MAG: transglycosylase SLT domain-containing protein, partial [Hyphomonadaceae bacterium]
MRILSIAAFAALTIMGACGEAQAPAAPAMSVPAPIGEPDLSRLREGLSAAQFGDWSGVRAARAQAVDPLARRILTWRLAAAQNSDALFDEVNGALAQLPGWPGRETMRRRGEQMIIDSGLAPEARIAWLGGEGGPLSGDGQMALAQAYMRAGRGAEAIPLAREAWRERALTPRAEAIALGEFGEHLTREDHAARVDRLLWRDDRAGAQRLLSRLSGSDRAVAAARIGLQARVPMTYRKIKRNRGKVGLSALLAAVPASRADDPGLLYDRARYVRRGGDPERALTIAARISTLSTAPTVRSALFAERRLYISRALRGGQRTAAYQFAANHGLTSGEDFADAEWLAGWIALRFMNDPAKAAEHFAHLESNVSTPVSKARALYWRAEAARTLGRAPEADADLAQAAAFSFTYYGQLAAERRGPDSVLSLGAAPAISSTERAAFESRELVRALRAVAAAGDRQSFELIAFALDDQLQTSAEHQMLSDLARVNYFARVAVRSAKAGLRRGIVAQDAAYPLIDLPAQAQGIGRPEAALVLAVARQESEFDAQAVSPVGARGLMQLMPYTAQHTARRWGVPYSPAALTADPAYNLTLGSAYLQELLDQFGGSYVLAIAAYNAGPSRVSQWVGDWGDPRSGSVDVIDWV